MRDDNVVMLTTGFFVVVLFGVLFSSNIPQTTPTIKEDAYMTQPFDIFSIWCYYGHLSETFLARLAAGKFTHVFVSAAHWGDGVSGQVLVPELSDGQISSFISQVKAAVPNVKVYAWVWSQIGLTNPQPDLSTNASRAQLVTQVVDFAVNKGFDGIQDDTEGWTTYPDWSHQTAYFNQLQTAMTAAGKPLLVYEVPYGGQMALLTVDHQMMYSIYQSTDDLDYDSLVWMFQTFDPTASSPYLLHLLGGAENHGYPEGPLSQQLANVDRLIDEYGQYPKLRGFAIYIYSSMTDADWIVWNNWVTAEEPPEPPAPTIPIYNGFSNYPDPLTTSSIQDVIELMHTHNQNVYRISSRPAYSPGTHPYREDLIQYYLENTPDTWIVIVDPNHLTPPGVATAAEADANWATIESTLLGVCATWPNVSRVFVELINEYYVSTNVFYSKMQGLIDAIRTAGYTNSLVYNKLTWVDGRNNWQVLTDAEDKLYDGYHVYMVDENLTTVLSSMKTAYNLGIKVLNTEVGPATLKANFTSSLVNDLESFIQGCNNLGFGCCSWLSHGASDWYPVYIAYGMDFPPATEAPPAPGEPPIPPPPEEVPPVPSPPEEPPEGPPPQEDPLPEEPEVPPTKPTVGLPEDLPTPLTAGSQFFSQALKTLSKYEPMRFDQVLRMAGRYKPLSFEEILRIAGKLKVA